jgi:hypothetical protein
MTKRLIEEWLPIADIGIESVRERTPMTPFPAPNRLHVWWARRPLVASLLPLMEKLTTGRTAALLSPATLYDAVVSVSYRSTNGSAASSPWSAPLRFADRHSVASLPSYFGVMDDSFLDGSPSSEMVGRAGDEEVTAFDLDASLPLIPCPAALPAPARPTPSCASILFVFYSLNYLFLFTASL